MNSAVYCQTAWNWSNDIIFMQNIINGEIPADDEDKPGSCSGNIEFRSGSMEDNSGVENGMGTDMAADKQDVDSLQQESACLYCGYSNGPPLILQHTLESYVHCVRCVAYKGLSEAVVPCTSHYDLYDEGLHDYILTSDELARSQFQSALELCSFCEEPIPSVGFCCMEYKVSVEQTGGKGAVRFNEGRNASDQTTAREGRRDNAKSASNRNQRDKDELRESNGEARRLAKQRSEQRKKERLLAFEAARKRRAMNNEAGVNRGQGNEGAAPAYTPGTKSGQPSTITYQLSSQKCIDDGWTVWPQAIAVRNGKRNSQDTLVTSFNQTANDVTANTYQENVGEFVISRFYDNGNIFVVIFPEGSGNVFYPDGRLAISIITVSEGLFTYIVQDDCADGNIMAVFLSSGHGVVYYLNGQPRIRLSPCGGEEFDINGARHRKWIWHDSSTCDTNPITLGINSCCSVRIISQYNMSLTYSAQCRSCRFRIGAQVKKPVDSRKLEPLSSTSSDDIYVREMKNRFEGLLLKVSSVLQFPHSPKLEHIPVSSHSQSRRQKLNKTSAVLPV